MSRVVLTTFAVFLVVTFGIGITYYYMNAQQAQNQATLTPVAAAYRHLTAEVAISGTTKASDAVDLAFRSGGIVDTAAATVGKAVATSTVLMTLRSNILRDQLAQMQADLLAQKAKLRNLQNGTRPEQIAVTKASLQSDETNLANAEQGLLNALKNAQSAANIAVRFTIDRFITNPSMSNSQLTIPVSDSALNNKVLSERQQLQGALLDWSTRVNALSLAHADALASASTDMHAYLGAVSTILDDLTRILAADDPVQFAADQIAVAAARSAITATIDALTAADQKVLAAQAAIGVTNQQIALEKAGSTAEVIAVQQAAVDGTQAQISQIVDELRDQRITAPFAGTVTAVDAKPGETVAAGATVVSMMSNGPLKVEGYVPEIHYADISVGQPVRILLDAFPGESFPGTLAIIDPSATLQDGVPNFKVTVYFTGLNPRIRPGLTANAYIQTADKPNVLAIPLGAVTGTGASATVMRVVGQSSERTHVVLGTTGVDGYVEVVSGLAEGDTVLVNETKQYRIVPN
ncbi:MAG: efflux RND transporter periplasmic adaptor subunit [Minisyncoccota bacterium]